MEVIFLSIKIATGVTEMAITVAPAAVTNGTDLTRTQLLQATQKSIG